MLMSMKINDACNIFPSPLTALSVSCWHLYISCILLLYPQPPVAWTQLHRTAMPPILVQGVLSAGFCWYVVVGWVLIFVQFHICRPS